MNYGPGTAGAQERPHVLPHRCGNRRLLLNGPRAQGRAGERETLHQNLAHVDLGACAAEQRNDDNLSLERCTVDVSPHVAARNDVQDDVDTLTVGFLVDDRDEVLSFVVYAADGSELLTYLHL